MAATASVRSPAWTAQALVVPAPAPPTPEPSTPESARTPSPPSQLPGDSRPAWDDAFASDFIEESPPPAPAPSKRRVQPRPSGRVIFNQCYQ